MAGCGGTKCIRSNATWTAYSSWVSSSTSPHCCPDTDKVHSDQINAYAYHVGLSSSLSGCPGQPKLHIDCSTTGSDRTEPCCCCQYGCPSSVSFDSGNTWLTRSGRPGSRRRKTPSCRTRMMGAQWLLGWRRSVEESKHVVVLESPGRP